MKLLHKEHLTREILFKGETFEIPKNMQYIAIEASGEAFLFSSKPEFYGSWFGANKLMFAKFRLDGEDIRESLRYIMPSGICRIV